MASVSEDPLSFLSAQDRTRFGKWAAAYEGARTAAEFYGQRPRRFSILLKETAADDLVSAPPPGTKRLRCLRHGEGEHNVFRAAEFAAGRTPHAKRGNIADVPPNLWDPPLTSKGEDEAREARPGAERGRDPDLVVTSPLRRACKTGLLVFERALKRGVPFVAHELAREMYSSADPSIYDSRRGRDELEQEFPSVSFRPYVAEAGGQGLQADPFWWKMTSPCEGCVLEQGETYASHVEKVWRLLCWIMDRPEQDVALSTHSLFLLALFHGVLEEENAQGARAAPASMQFFRTGELRSLIIKERPAPNRPVIGTAARGFPASSFAIAVAAFAVGAVAGIGLLKGRRW